MHHTSENQFLTVLLSQLFSLLNHLQLTLARLVVVVVIIIVIVVIVIQISWSFLHHKVEHFKRSIAANDFIGLSSSCKKQCILSNVWNFVIVRSVNF